VDRLLADRSPYAAELDRLLDGDFVAEHDLVYGGLLIEAFVGRALLQPADCSCPV
jgi:hypothetical protein